MPFIQVDQEKCLKDGLCVLECPMKILEQDDHGFPFAVQGAEEFCIDCGHCVAVCPSQALDHRSAQSDQCRPLSDTPVLNTEQTWDFLASRRSLRVFRKEPVDKNTIEELINLAGYAPSGHNTQPARWLVIMDDQKVHKIASLIVDWMRWMLDNKPELALPMHMDIVVEAWDKGIDRVLRGAPQLIVAYSEKDMRTAPAAIVSNIAYLELAAPSWGVGTCWAGYFTAAAQNYPPLQQELALPENCQVYGGVMIGKPKLKYNRIPIRKKTDITWS